jgi:hypothetical protein
VIAWIRQWFGEGARKRELYRDIDAYIEKRDAIQDASSAPCLCRLERVGDIVHIVGTGAGERELLVIGPTRTLFSELEMLIEWVETREARASVGVKANQAL